jgi:transposase
MKASIPRLEISMEQLQKLVERARTGPLSEEEYTQLKGAIETLGYLTLLMEDQDTTIQRLRQILFGPKTESTEKILQQIGKNQEKNPREEASRGEANSSAPDKDSGASGSSRQGNGHGRNGVQAYGGGNKVQVPHAHLQRGNRCPECQKGKLYELNTPGVLVRVTGQAPLAATVYALQKLRCNLCGEVYTAEAPEGVGPEKYDERAGSMVAMLKYGSGVPFTRLEKLQANLEVPLPTSTQWEIAEAVAEVAAPAYEELIRQAAQGEVLYNDDTKMRVLALMRESPPAPAEAAQSKGNEEGIDPDRTGVFTSGIVSTREGKKIALFFTGRKHAGENLADVLAHRAAELGPPIQICDALAANVSEDLQVIIANCNLHGRRKFIEVAHNFPEECRYVLETFRDLYKHEAQCCKQQMTPEQRLAFHQVNSGPLMEGLKDWMEKQFAERKVEPNSGLGKAIRYMQKHWPQLTLFLHKAGVPLDTNMVERTLKRAILHRKNALFYKTENGAAVGDLFMSLIHTCELHGVNAFDYLTALQLHAGELAHSPQEWMPWSFSQTRARLPTVA